MSGHKVTFGLIADVHHGLAPTAMSRLEAFMEAVDKRKPDFVLQLGDFCFGDQDSAAFLRLWNEFRGPRLHVLGNHDMDRLSKVEGDGGLGNARSILRV